MFVLVFSLVALLTVGWYRRPNTARQVLRRCWALLRPLVGWASMIVGLLGVLLPIVPGIPCLALGIALLGRRDPWLRRTSIVLKLRFRAWARQSGVRCHVGRYGWRLTIIIGHQLDLLLTRQSRKGPSRAAQPEETCRHL